LTAFPNAKGFGNFTLNDAKDRLKYSVTVKGLSGPITGAHIHLGEYGKTGPIVHPLGTFVNGVSDSTWVIPDSLVPEFTAGNLYVNVHTALNPGGEIRDNISTGIFPRTNLAPPYSPPAPKISTYTAHRMPDLGLNFYVAPWPKGPKAVEEIAPGSGSVVDRPNNSSTYSVAGPIGSFEGARENELNVEIRFQAGINYAITKAPVPPQAKFIQVPFAAYKDTVRVMVVVDNVSATDTVWNVDPLNGKVNGKPVFDMISGIVDSKDGGGVDISYYGPNPVFPPTSNGTKGRYINGANHILKDIKIINESGDGKPPAVGTKIKFFPNKSVKLGDRRRFEIKAVQTKVTAAAKTEVNRINVFPNPYYAVNSSERTRQARYVTFNHLPEKATIRIFNLAGTLVASLEKNSPQQFFEWDLTNHKGLPVASGIYLVHIDMGDLGVKILKSAIIMEQQFLDNY
jgi:hypothetical protein